MRVPQEIVDAIIDHFSISERNRERLFAIINCAERRRMLSRIDKLLTGSPQIGRLYIRHFRLGIRASDILSPPLATRILPLLPNLVRFDLVAERELSVSIDIVRAHQWEKQPPLFRTAVEQTHSLRSLRALRLCHYSFSNAAALDSLLGHATALQDLSLKEIRFRDSSSDRISSALREATVVLASLTLQDVEQSDIDEMLITFSAVDIKHLRSLDIMGSPPASSLLVANAQTIHIVWYQELELGDVVDPDILAGNTSLRSIQVVEPYGMPSSLWFFGTLNHRTALKTISLQFDDETASAAEVWSELNAILAQAGSSLEAVHIYALAEYLPGPGPDSPPR
ncbi:hypothetical protein C8J57DRAFT_1493961 [Mycena rebaudengoi]|nr:hypothetical protein C8J57DRAFT_1493961 [Mycena rebaudengoi]